MTTNPRRHVFTQMHRTVLAKHLRDYPMNKKERLFVANVLAKLFRERVDHFKEENWYGMVLGLTELKYENYLQDPDGNLSYGKDGK